MAIFIKNISEHTHLSDIYHFVTPALQRHFPFKTGHVAKTEILTLLDMSTHEVELYGLVFVEPEGVEQRVIRKLNGKRLQKNLVTVKEYRRRDWHNDRRINYAGVREAVVNRRVADRRRGQRVELIKDTAMSW